MSASRPTHYQVLMVDPGVDTDLLTTVYRRLVQRLQDASDGSPSAMARLQSVEQAYAVLSDRDLRRTYDAGLRLHDDNSESPVTREVPAVVPVQARVAVAVERPTSTATIRGNVLDFGRYAGWSLRQIAARDRDYLEWLRRTPGGRQYQAEIATILGSR